MAAETKGRFEPKTPVELAPPKDDPISLDHLAKCDGWWRVAPQISANADPVQGFMKDIPHTWPLKLACFMSLLFRR